MTERERERMTEQEWGREREIGPLEVSNVRHKSCSLFLHVRHCSPQVPSSRCANFLFCFTRVYQLQVTVFLVSVDSAAVPGLTWNGLQWLVWKEMDWVTILSRNYGLQWLIWILVMLDTTYCWYYLLFILLTVKTIVKSLLLQLILLIVDTTHY